MVTEVLIDLTMIYSGIAQQTEELQDHFITGQLATKSDLCEEGPILEVCGKYDGADSALQESEPHPASLLSRHMKARINSCLHICNNAAESKLQPSTFTGTLARKETLSKREQNRALMTFLVLLQLQQRCPPKYRQVGCFVKTANNFYPPLQIAYIKVHIRTTKS